MGSYGNAIGRDQRLPLVRGRVPVMSRLLPQRSRMQSRGLVDADTILHAPKPASVPGQFYPYPILTTHFLQVGDQALGWRREDREIYSPQGRGGFSSAKCSDRLRGPPTVPGILSPAVKRPVHEAVYSSSAEVKNEWRYTSKPPVCLRGVHRDSVTFLHLQSAVFLSCSWSPKWPIFPRVFFLSKLQVLSSSPAGHVQHFAEVSASAAIKTFRHSYKSQKITLYLLRPDIFPNNWLPDICNSFYAFRFVQQYKTDGSVAGLCVYQCLSLQKVDGIVIGSELRNLY